MKTIHIAGITLITAIAVVGRPSAQAPAIAGSVTDRVGSVLPGVAVTIVPERGGVAQHTTSDAVGRYRFDAVADGRYRIDFALPGFELVRMNHVRISSGAPASIDAALRVGTLCEYPQRRVPEAAPPVEGQVLDEANRPLPHATIELAANRYFERAFTDREGRFRVRVPVGSRSQLTAYDSGFEKVTQELSPATAKALVLRLRFTGTQDVEDYERLDRHWHCPADLFTHEGP